MSTMPRVRIQWEQVESGALRMIIFEAIDNECLTGGVEWCIRDIMVHDNPADPRAKEWFEDMLLEAVTPWSGRKGRPLRRRMA